MEFFLFACFCSLVMAAFSFLARDRRKQNDPKKGNAGHKCYSKMLRYQHETHNLCGCPHHPTLLKQTVLFHVNKVAPYRIGKGVSKDRCFYHVGNWERQKWLDHEHVKANFRHHGACLCPGSKQHGK